MWEHLPSAIVDFVEAKWGTAAAWVAAVAVAAVAIAVPFVIFALL